jgi:F-type H+-transporting ATPase subunit epsilon
MPTLTTPLQVIIVSPDKTILEAEANRVFVPGIIQELAILPHHTPLYSELVKGVIKVEATDGTIKEIDIDSGIIRVRQNRVSIILGFDADTERLQPEKTAS